MHTHIYCISRREMGRACIPGTRRCNWKPLRLRTLSNAHACKSALKCRTCATALICPRNEMKLKQNSFKTVSKQFRNCFVSARLEIYQHCKLWY